MHLKNACMEFDHVFIFSETEQAANVLILYILKYFHILSYSELLITFDGSSSKEKIPIPNNSYELLKLRTKIVLIVKLNL